MPVSAITKSLTGTNAGQPKFYEAIKACPRANVLAQSTSNVTSQRNDYNKKIDII